MKTKAIFIVWIVSIGVAYPQGYFPLEIGNLWEYRDRYDSTYSFTTHAISDTVMPNAATYMFLQSDHELGSQFCRQVGPKVFSYATHRLSDSTYWTGEEIMFDFSKTTFDTVTVRYYGPDTITVIVSYDRIKNVFGKLRRQWGFYEVSQRTSFYTLWEMTDSVGLTYYTYEPGIIADELGGAIINGSRYGTITTVDNSLTTPVFYEFSQNYPNPFNPKTELSFELADWTLVMLKVYDVLGREIVTLVNERKSPGKYTITWNAETSPSGVYFCLMQAGKFEEVRKMILLR